MEGTWKDPNPYTVTEILDRPRISIAILRLHSVQVMYTHNGSFIPQAQIKAFLLRYIQDEGTIYRCYDASD